MLLNKKKMFVVKLFCLFTIKKIKMHDNYSSTLFFIFLFPNIVYILLIHLFYINSIKLVIYLNNSSCY